MHHSVVKNILIALSFLTVLCPIAASADMGPKPTMEFNVIFKTTKPVTVITGEQYVCQDKKCHDPKKLKEYGPQRFSCENNRCRSLAYGYGGAYNIIKIQFSDKTRTSDIFRNLAFNATYDLVVDDEQIHVIDKTTFLKKYQVIKFSVAFLITTVIELIVALILVILARLPKKILFLVFFENIVTLPVIWFIIPELFGSLVANNYRIDLLLKEILVILTESLFIFTIFRRYLTWKTALMLGTAINMASWVIGMWIEYILNFFIFHDLYGTIEKMLGII